jgi:flagellar hook protein FlgE
MSILNTAVSGMLANTNWLTTIAQNVANANTYGYKNVGTSFSALVDSSQNLNGVTSSTIAYNGLQGLVQKTNTATDLAVQGSGFFIVEDGGGSIYLTRNGSFVPDASGNLINTAGYYLLGIPHGQQSVALNTLSGLVKVNIANGGASATPSTVATLVANLPSTASVITGPLPSANTPNSQFTAQTSLVAYDDLGAPHTINFYYSKTAANTWQVDAYDASTAAASGGFPYSSGPLATQTLTFSPTTGELTARSPVAFTVPGGQPLSVSLGQTTQLAAAFAVSSTNINGSAPGTITNVDIGPDGTLSFDYGNGAILPAYTIPLANVASPSNLNSIHGDAFQTNPQSGAPQVNIAGTAGLGTIDSASLEGSTVDLATELTNMVQAQSSYEANSKVFQAGAKVLDVLNSIQS